MIDIPEILAFPSTNFNGDAATSVVRTSIEKGLIEQEGRFSNGLETFSANWVLSAAEFAIFEEFFNETLAGGVLTFGLPLPDGDGYEAKPCRFVGGVYNASHRQALWYDVSARIEHLSLNNAPANRTPAVPVFMRMAVDPMASQTLTLSHRNGLLTVRPTSGNTTTLRIFPPIDATQYIYFGINNQGLGDTLITSQDVDPIPPVVIPDFPADFPAVNNNFAQDAERIVQRVQMDSGHPRQITGSETTVASYQVEWEFSLEELKDFQEFFYVTLKSGGLPFNLTLPVDGSFIPVVVRIAEGKFRESYVPVDRWKVSCTLDRIVNQTIAPATERPYPLYYSPTVNVNANLKVRTADANKFFVLTPDEGQTINLHIGPRLLEFGVLIKGLGNVLITRAPFVYDVGSFDDSAHTSYLKPAFELHNSLRDLGVVATDYAATVYQKPAFELIAVIEDIGTLATDFAATAYGKPAFDLLAVLEDVGTVETDFAATTYQKPIFEITIP
jgi:hypothetical protein